MASILRGQSDLQGSFAGILSRVQRAQQRCVPQQSARSSSTVAPARPCSGRIGNSAWRRPLHISARGGNQFSPDEVKVTSSIGSGSFGQCFKGTLHVNGCEKLVILKRVKARVRGAAEMAEMEHAINVYASKAKSRAVADFLGFVEVPETRGQLTRGLWLVWRYQGDKTLAYYLKQRNCIQALAADLDVPGEMVVPTVMQQLFEALLDIHSIGLVHRDVKPANTVLDEAERRFKLIDLGAAADLRTGTNYKPLETILDPCYSPPEEYVLPTDAPALDGSPLACAMSPLLWSQHRPDCFDSYSAGIVLMQLALPALRKTASLRLFSKALASCGYDLEEWRARSALTARGTAILDARGGAGWDLAAGLLRERKVETDGTGGVRFVSSGAPRLTPAAALKHPFIRAAAEAAWTEGMLKRVSDRSGSLQLGGQVEAEAAVLAAVGGRRRLDSTGCRSNTAAVASSRRQENGSRINKEQAAAAEFLSA